MYALERTVDAFKRFGVKKTKGYELIEAGLFPAPIKPNERPSRVPSQEVDALIAATISGVGEEYIIKLILGFRNQRAVLATKQEVL